jgi:hypothetical protein
MAASDSQLAFESENVVAEVFSGMGNHGQAGVRVKAFYTKHVMIVAERARLPAFRLAREHPLAK